MRTLKILRPIPSPEPRNRKNNEPRSKERGLFVLVDAGLCWAATSQSSSIFTINHEQLRRSVFRREHDGPCDSSLNSTAQAACGSRSAVLIETPTM
jgi:hypothetical protein